MEKTLDKSMKSNVKQNCVMCGVKFDDPESNYIDRGNYCVNCNAKCERLAKSRRRQLPEKYGEQEIAEVFGV